MSRLSNEELNKYCHEVIFGECWHEGQSESIKIGLRFVPCIKCNEKYRVFASKPDYCSSLDAVSRVEQKVIENVGAFVLGIALEKVLHKDVTAKQIATHDEIVMATHFATARQRAEACKLAWEVNK